jgi:lipopolysaccharide heptosyltransferase II
VVIKKKKKGLKSNITKRKHLNTVSNILIIRLSSIGDIILTTPVIRAVKKQFPDARITFLIKKEFIDLVKYNPNIDAILTVDKSKGRHGLKELREQIKNEKYDWIIDLHKNLRSTYLKRGSGAVYKTKYPKLIFKRTLLVKLGINLYKTIRPVYLRYFEAVKKAGITYDNLGTEVYYPAEDENIVREKLLLEGYENTSSIVVLCPGAKHATKQWLPERYIEVAKKLIAEKKFTICLAGGREEIQLCEDIKNAVGQKIISLAGSLSLLQSAALLKMGKLCVVNDSGLMHLAQSQKTPVLAIFGSTTKELGFFPFEENSVVVEYPISCRPCSHIGREKCPKEHFKCMKEIQVEDVMKGIYKLI